MSRHGRDRHRATPNSRPHRVTAAGAQRALNSMRPSYRWLILIPLGAALAAISIWAVPGAKGIVGAGLALIMLAIAASDLRHLIIPNELNAAALALGLVNAALDAPVVENLGTAVVRGAVALLFFWGIRVAYRRWRGREGLGLGDVKLAFIAGVWLDWTLIAVAVEIAALTALFAYGALFFFAKRQVSAATRLPFGLFFAPAIWLSWLCGVWFSH